MACRHRESPNAPRLQVEIHRVPHLPLCPSSSDHCGHSLTPESSTLPAHCDQCLGQHLAVEE